MPPPTTMDAELYLAPEAGCGCPYCFDPDSTALRYALLRGGPGADTPIATADLAKDVRWYHQLLRRQYAGYIDLVRHVDFDVDAFFADWEQVLLRAGPALPFRDAVISPLITLLSAVPDGHLTFRGAGPRLANDERITAHEYQALVIPDFRTHTADAARVPGVWAASWRTAPFAPAVWSRPGNALGTLPESSAPEAAPSSTSAVPAPPPRCNCR